MYETPAPGNTGKVLPLHELPDECLVGLFSFSVEPRALITEGAGRELVAVREAKILEGARKAHLSFGL